MERPLWVSRRGGNQAGICVSLTRSIKGMQCVHVLQRCRIIRLERSITAWETVSGRAAGTKQVEKLGSSRLFELHVCVSVTATAGTAFTDVFFYSAYWVHRRVEKKKNKSKTFSFWLKISHSRHFSGIGSFKGWDVCLQFFCLVALLFIQAEEGNLFLVSKH